MTYQTKHTAAIAILSRMTMMRERWVGVRDTKYLTQRERREYMDYWRDEYILCRKAFKEIMEL